MLVILHLPSFWFAPTAYTYQIDRNTLDLSLQHLRDDVPEAKEFYGLFPSGPDFAKIRTQQDLETFLKEQPTRAHIYTDQSFPFRMEHIVSDIFRMIQEWPRSFKLYLGFLCGCAVLSCALAQTTLWWLVYRFACREWGTKRSFVQNVETMVQLGIGDQETCLRALAAADNDPKRALKILLKE